MTARKCLGYGLIAGLTKSEAMQTAPGQVIDLYIMRRDYDDAMHGIVRKAAGAWRDE